VDSKSVPHGSTRRVVAMNARRLLLTFGLAFSLGILVACWLLQRQAGFGTDPAAPAAKASVTPPPSTPGSDGGNTSKDDGANSKDDGDGDSDSSKWPDDAGSPEQVMYAQAHLMDAAIDKLAARTPGKPNLYVITFAGDGEEDVFRNE